MANDIGSSSSGWQLVMELALKAEPASLQQATELIAETIQALCIQAVIVERIQRTVTEALQGMIENETLVRQDSPIRLRVLVSGGPCDKETEENTHHSWGFFLIEKQRNSLETPYHRLELFLYQENFET